MQRVGRLKRAVTEDGAEPPSTQVIGQPDDSMAAAGVESAP